MKAFLFSDLHCSIKQVVKLKEFLDTKEGKNIGALIFAGDVVNMGEPVWVAEDLVRFLDKVTLPFFWVPGNNDFGRAYHKINAKYKSLEGRVAELKVNQSLARFFAGVGGSPASWAGQYQGENIIDKKSIAGTIFVSHVPPPGVFNYLHKDLPTPLLKNLKSEAPNSKQPESQNDQGISKNIDLPRKKLADAPLVHICGHIHHQWGCAYLGQTKIIKLASFETGNYAILDLEDLSVDFKRFS